MDEGRLARGLSLRRQLEQERPGDGDVVAFTEDVGELVGLPAKSLRPTKPQQLGDLQPVAQPLRRLAYVVERHVGHLSRRVVLNQGRPLGQPLPLLADATAYERTGVVVGAGRPTRLGDEPVEARQQVGVPRRPEHREDRVVPALVVVAGRRVCTAQLREQEACRLAVPSRQHGQPLLRDVLVPGPSQRAGQPPQLLAQRLADPDVHGRPEHRQGRLQAPARHACFVHAFVVPAPDAPLGLAQGGHLLDEAHAQHLPDRRLVVLHDRHEECLPDEATRTGGPRSRVP